MLAGTLAFLAGRSTCCADLGFRLRLSDAREALMNVNAKPQSGFTLEPVHPKPEQAHTMPYAPAVHIVGACDLIFLSGATPSPLYHKHPHVEAEHVHPHSIEEQTTQAMEAIKSILDHTGASWRAPSATICCSAAPIDLAQRCNG